jgi:hypothetical protein
METSRFNGFADIKSVPLSMAVETALVLTVFKPPVQRPVLMIPDFVSATFPEV